MPRIQKGLDGFERTGEFRLPEDGEFYESAYGGHVYERSFAKVKSPRHILRKVNELRGRRLTVTQSETKTTFEGEFDFTVEDLDAYVQVEFPGTHYKRYAYRDPSRSLKVGDFVVAPTQYDNDQVATVVALGRGSWNGSVRDITARFTRQEIAA